jgi:hypothetical protein
MSEGHGRGSLVPGLFLTPPGHGTVVPFNNAHLPSVSERADTRIHSNNSTLYAQYLDIHQTGFTDTEDERTPMSVRPFSSSESFAFPQPPFKSSEYSPTGATRASVVTTTALSILPKSPAAASMIPSPTMPILNEANPFADPSFSPVFAEVEVIQRPFVPTLVDELAVRFGDNVKVMAVFDDGWVKVEKVDQGNAGVPENKSGIIPVDCLRVIGQDLPEFLRGKRISSLCATGVAV